MDAAKILKILPEARPEVSAHLLLPPHTGCGPGLHLRSVIRCGRRHRRGGGGAGSTAPCPLLHAFEGGKVRRQLRKAGRRRLTDTGVTVAADGLPFASAAEAELEAAVQVGARDMVAAGRQVAGGPTLGAVFRILRNPQRVRFLRRRCRRRRRRWLLRRQRTSLEQRCDCAGAACRRVGPSPLANRRSYRRPLCRRPRSRMLCSRIRNRIRQRHRCAVSHCRSSRGCRWCHTRPLLCGLVQTPLPAAVSLVVRGTLAVGRSHNAAQCSMERHDLKIRQNLGMRRPLLRPLLQARGPRWRRGFHLVKLLPAALAMACSHHCRPNQPRRLRAARVAPHLLGTSKHRCRTHRLRALLLRLLCSIRRSLRLRNALPSTEAAERGAQPRQGAHLAAAGGRMLRLAAGEAEAATAAAALHIRRRGRLRGCCLPVRRAYGDHAAAPGRRAVALVRLQQVRPIALQPRKHRRRQQRGKGSVREEAGRLAGGAAHHPARRVGAGAAGDHVRHRRCRVGGCALRMQRVRAARGQHRPSGRGRGCAEAAAAAAACHHGHRSRSRDDVLQTDEAVWDDGASRTRERTSPPPPAPLLR